MSDFTYIENYISEFVDRHVSEKITIVIKPPKAIAIESVRKNGSILLGMFWIKVLQNKHNFPPQSVSYNRRKTTNKQEQIVLFIEDVMISLNLLNGRLEIQGLKAIEWFRTRLLDVIRNYIGCGNGGYNGNTVMYKDEQKEFNVVSSKYYSNHAFKDHILSNSSGGTNARESTILEEEHLSNLMIDSVLDMACESVRQSSLKQSKPWIYRFWKSLLYKWTSDVNVKIVIASSQIDPRRLQDISDISLLLRASSQIISIYVPYHCSINDKHQNINEVKMIALSPYNPNEKLWIEYEIFNKIVLPKTGIGCNFIAGIFPNNKVQMMLTSCRFHSTDFDCINNHSVQYMEMSEMQFDRDFISTLQS